MLKKNVQEFAPLSNQIRNIVFMLHGYGDNAINHIKIASLWHDEIADTLFVAINAPQNCPNSIDGRQWFDLQDFKYVELPILLKDSNIYLQDIIAAYSEEYSSCKIILSGFSQGAMVSLYNGVYGHYKVNAVIGFSGGFINTHIVQFHKIPVMIVHGKEDLVVPVDNAYSAQKSLIEIGITPEMLIEQKLDHSISYNGLKASAKFINKILEHE